MWHEYNYHAPESQETVKKNQFIWSNSLVRVQGKPLQDQAWNYDLKKVNAGADPGFGRGRGGGSDLVKRCDVWCVAGVQDLLKGTGSFWVFNAQICILPHSRDSFSLIFDTYFNT